MAAIGSIVAGLTGAGNKERGEANSKMNMANEIMQSLQNAPEQARPVILEQYRQAGILTPELEATISAGPAKAESVTTEGQGKEAQLEALKKLSDVSKTGMSAADRAALNQARSQAQGDEESKRQQIMQQYAAQGRGGMGAELAAQLASSQSSANQQAAESDRLMQMAQQNALQATGAMANLGQGLEAQQFGQGMQKAQAADEMQRFNIGAQQQQQMRNIGAKNQAQASNLANLQNISNVNVGQGNQELYRQRSGEQQDWQNKMNLASKKASNLAGQAENLQRQGDVAAKGAQQIGAGIGGLAGGFLGFAEGGKVEDYRDGGKVDGRAKHEGDHPENDTVDAVLSPGEIVIPRSLAKSSLGDKLLDLLNAHHEIKSHLDSLDKKVNKPKKKMVDGGKVPSIDPNSLFMPGETKKQPLAMMDTRSADKFNTDSAKQLPPPSLESMASVGSEIKNRSLLDKMKDLVGTKENPTVLRKAITGLNEGMGGDKINSDEQLSPRMRFSAGENLPVAQTEMPKVLMPETNSPIKMSEGGQVSDLEQLYNKYKKIHLYDGTKEPVKIPVDFEEPEIIRARPDIDKEIINTFERDIQESPSTEGNIIKEDELDQIQKLQDSLQKDEKEKFTSDEDTLRDAQKKRQSRIDLGKRGRFADLIASGMLKTAPLDKSFFDDLSKDADLPVKEYGELIENKENDPNSEMSTIVRGYLKNKGLDVSDKSSASDLLKVAPFLAKDEQLKILLEKAKLLEQGREDRFKESEANKDKRNKEWMALREKQQKALEGQRDFSNLNNFQQNFNRDKIFLQAREALNAVDNARSLLAMKNPVADQATLRQLARLAGEVGVLTDQDVKAFGGSKAVADNIQQFVETAAKGTFTDKNRNYMKKLVDTFEKRRNEQIKGRAMEIAKQGSIKFNQPVDEVYNYLLPGESLPAKSSQRDTSSVKSDEKIVVEKDGKQYKLPKSQLQDAISQGYVQVK